MIVGGPYDPYTSQIIPIFILYAFLFPAGFILAGKLIRKGKQQNLKSAIYLGLSFLCYAAAIFIAFIGLLDTIIVQEFRELYRLSLPLGYSLGLIGNLFLLGFGFNLFGFRKKIAILFGICTGLVLILINLDSNWYGVPHYVYAGQFSMRFYSSLSMTVLALCVYLYLIQRINSLQIEKSLVKLGYKLIIWSLIAFFMFWVFMTFDAVYIYITGGGYSFFTFIAWIFALLFWFLSYIGLIMPAKIKHYFETQLMQEGLK